MTVIKLITLLLVLFVTAIAAQDCRVTVQQQLRSSWTSEEGTYSLYDVLLMNAGTVGVRSVTLSSDSVFEGIWEMNNIGNNQYTLPDWRGQVGVAVDSSHEFGYVIKSASPAQLTVISCDDGPVSPVPVDPTQEPTDAPIPTEPTKDPLPTDVSAPTEAPVPPTDAPTAEPTAEPTEEPEPTDPAATRRPSRAPTAEPTRKPATAPPTQRPATDAPSQRPATERPATSAPTQKSATGAPTGAPTPKTGTAPSSGGKVCSGNTWWQPPPLTTYQWQLTGSIDTSIDVEMYDIDLFDLSASTVSTLHKAGRVVICYFSTQFEDWRPDASAFTSAVKGNNLDDWAGEKYVDSRSSVVRSIMAARMDLAASKGCDGVEPDNVDSYQANSGFPLTSADGLDYLKWFSAQAHARGLSIGLKNDLGQAKALVSYFDWALNEQCYEYGECTDLSPFVNAGKAVFVTEYKGSASTVCNYMNGLKFTALLKDLSLGAKINAQCCTYRAGGCARISATPKCGGSTVSNLLEEQTQEMTIPIDEMFDSGASSTIAVYAVVLATVVCGLLIA